MKSFIQGFKNLATKATRKEKVLTLLLVISSLITMAQTSPINPSRIVVGDASSTVPTPNSEYDGIPLNIWRANTANMAALRVSDPNAHITIAVPTCNGCWNPQAAFGDVVIRFANGVNNLYKNNKLIFDIPGGYPTNTRQVIFGTDYNKTLSINNNGKVGIGVGTLPNDASYNLFVKNGIKTERLKIELCSAGSWCDYVFDSTYKLAPLDTVANQIQANKHLPNMPSATQLEQEEGFEVGDMTKMHQEKIEELFLYVIDLNKKLQAVQEQTKKLKAENEVLKQTLQKTR